MKPATHIVHWPGQDTPACDEHAVKLVSLAAHMGFRVSSTPCDTGEMCANCVTEAVKAIMRHE